MVAKSNKVSKKNKQTKAGLLGGMCSRQLKLGAQAFYGTGMLV
jgi:hypothetical protein